jgi:four helix bundle protein
MVIWKDSIDMVKNIYTICAEFPVREKYGIVSQLQRAAVSISANIAEGSGRSSDADFKRFFSFSVGSAYELETLVTIAKEVGYLEEENCFNLTEKLQHLQKMICKFSRQLQ